MFQKWLQNGAFPLGVVLLLIPSWITFFLFERDDYDTEHLLYYHIPDLTQNPIVIPINLTITPLVNTEFDQIILVTVLFVAFGAAVERRLGIARLFALFWLASAAAALGGGVLLHVLYPLFPDVEVFSSGGWERVFNGGSAGGFGFLGAFAALSNRPWLWIALFLVWEPSFWLLVSEDYTSVFHFIAVTTGILFGWRCKRAAQQGKLVGGNG